MKFQATLAVLAAFALSACETTTGSSTVIDTLIGKPLVTDNGNTFLFNPDGTVGGNIGSNAVKGTYSANTQEVCSNLTAPKSVAGREFCSVPRIDGDVVVFDRRDGSQSPAYKIGG
ncbi:MAG: META domain-containing protein [Epibacterium sp.]|nr:META domain-containing protein [Epibacterium sp.]NQX75669.1 hypothetical protein [Epibacterium sp.]